MNFHILEKINGPEDLKKLTNEELKMLPQEIRRFLVSKVSKSGGHLASNLGVVEITIALLLSLNFPEDKIVWDVGHQSYVYKLLTGRRDRFDKLRSTGGISGFPKRRESEYDSFNTGHSSTSISAALGIAKAFEIEGKENTVVAVIGDGSLTGGLAFEALNNASKLKRNLIIILNDNNMSISENVGGLSAYLSNLRAGTHYNGVKDGVVDTLENIPIVGEKLIKSIKKTKSSLKQLIVPGMLFEDMGLTYLGPFDGHNVQTMVRILKEAKKIDHPVVIHVNTIKGKGYKPAELNPSKFHGIDSFDPRTGELKSTKKNPSNTAVFGEALCEVAAKNEKIVAITAAMPDGTGLKLFKDKYPDRFFDVGIAEQHAVTYAAGLAAGGCKPFVAIYSSFLQRAYDQIMMDVCIQNLPVVFCVDRAGLVGRDGETHQGIFDISYLSSIPNLNIIAPKNAEELREAVNFAAGFNGPIAIRYSRGEAYNGLSEYNTPIELGKSEPICMEKDIAIVFAGSMAETAVEVRNRLKEKGLSVTLINARFIKPIDENMIMDVSKDHHVLITMEENVISGGYGSAVLRYVNTNRISLHVINIALPNLYVEQGTPAEQKKECRIDIDSILERLENELN